MAKKMIKWIQDLFRGGDENHEGLKDFYYHAERGHVTERNGGFVWVTDKEAMWKDPKDETNPEI
jgi:hypothetical protein